MTKYKTIGRVTKSANPWKTAKLVAYFEQGRQRCEVAGCANHAREAHHGIVKRDKNCVKVDSLINVVMVCHKCHMEGKADGWANVKRNISRAVNRYGRDEVEKWLLDLAEEGKQVQEQFNYIAERNEND